MLCYLKVPFDFEKGADALTPEEKGALLLAMLRYASTGEDQADTLSGGARILWARHRMDIDREQACYEAKASAGRKGGLARAQNAAAEAGCASSCLPLYEKEKEKENDQSHTHEKEKEKENARAGADARARDGFSFRDCLDSPGDGLPEGTRLTMDFDRFWEAYPRKVGRISAEKIWAHLCPAPELVERMLGVLEKERANPQWKVEGGRYIPYPASWLANARWEDVPWEPPAARPGAEEEEVMRQWIGTDWKDHSSSKAPV